MRLAVLGWLLWGCGPVLLGEEPVAGSAGTSANGGGLGGAAGADAPSAVGVGSSGHAAVALPAVVVHIKAVDCGSCYELQAEGSGGQAPYSFEWGDGARGAQQRVCIGEAAVVSSVVAVDASGARSAPETTRLEAAGDAGCGPMIDDPVDAGAAPMLCLQNPSLEGTPAANFGQASAFDAPPWSTCTNPVMDNTPDIGNDTLAVTGGVPPPTDGLTDVALGEGEQVSQELCQEIAGGTTVHLALDVTAIDISGGAVPQTEKVFLEIYGGLAVDCSQRELLWASPAVQAGWQSFCVTLQPSSFTTQLTFRANADMTSINIGYLLVDNLQPVDGCP